jgi:hypothetical protein
MGSFSESIKEYKRQLEKGAIQEAYQGLMQLRIPMKSSTCSGHAVHLSERSDASVIIIPSSGRHEQGRIDLAP